MIDFNQIKLLTFDCYGTLVDWEAGITNCLQPILKAHGIAVDNDELLTRYAAAESQLESGSYQTYKAVLTAVLQRLGNDLGFQPARKHYMALPASLPHWPPFPDTIESLRQLHRLFKLAVISNIDDDLFLGTSRTLGISFDWVVTAQQVQAYKPARAVFERALATVGIAKEQVLHVAQSLYHDIAPANQLGLKCCWVNRRHDKPGSGATPEATASPDLEVPDLKTLVKTVG